MSTYDKGKLKKFLKHDEIIYKNQLNGFVIFFLFSLLIQTTVILIPVEKWRNLYKFEFILFAILYIISFVSYKTKNFVKFNLYMSISVLIASLTAYLMSIKFLILIYNVNLFIIIVAVIIVIATVVLISIKNTNKMLFDSETPKTSKSRNYLLTIPSGLIVLSYFITPDHMRSYIFQIVEAIGFFSFAITYEYFAVRQIIKYKFLNKNVLSIL